MPSVFIPGHLFPLSLLIALILVVIAAGCSPTAASPSSTEPTDARWNPTFADITGNTLRPFDSPSTKAIALIFVIPDCPIANSFLPELNRLHDSFEPQGIHLLLVHVDPETTNERAARHAADHELRLPVILDSDQKWTKKAGVSISPEAAVFSPTGELLYRGRINDQFVALGKRRAIVTSHDLRDALDTIIADQPVAPSRTEAIGCPIPLLGEREASASR